MNIVILISGNGSTEECVIKACQSGEIPDSQVVHVISSKASAGGIEKAKALGVPTTVLKLHKDFDDNHEAFGQAILKVCSECHADLIAQLGWLVKTPKNVLEEFFGRVINQHPGPLDFGRLGFGGEGMYGPAVHKAVIKFAQLINRPFLTEAIVHRVTNEEYDSGSLLGVRAMLVRSDDTPEALADRLLPIEHELVKEVISRFATNQPLSVQKPMVLIPEADKQFYFEAIKFALSQKHN